MAASTAVHSYGTTLGVADTSGGSYTPIAELVTIPSEDESVGATKVSHLSSDSRAHEFIPSGFYDPGECQFTLNFTKTQYNTMLGYRRTTKYWKITLPDASIIGPFAGFWTKRGVAIPEDDKITCEFTLKKTGALAFTAGA